MQKKKEILLNYDKTAMLTVWMQPKVVGLDKPNPTLN